MPSIKQFLIWTDILQGILLLIEPVKERPLSSLTRTRLNNEAFILQWPFGDINRMPKIDAAATATAIAAAHPFDRGTHIAAW